MHRSSSALLLMAAAALGGAAGCAETPPAAQPGPGAPLRTAGLSGSRDERLRTRRHVIGGRRHGGGRLLPGAFGGPRWRRGSTEIARTDFTRLRRGRLYLTEGLPDRGIEELRRRLTDAFGAGNGPAILDLTAQLIERNQADIRAHMLRAVASRQAGNDEGGPHAPRPGDRPARIDHGGRRRAGNRLRPGPCSTSARSTRS